MARLSVLQELDSMAFKQATEGIRLNALKSSRRLLPKHMVNLRDHFLAKNGVVVIGLDNMKCGTMCDVVNFEQQWQVRQPWPPPNIEHPLSCSYAKDFIWDVPHGTARPIESGVSKHLSCRPICFILRESAIEALVSSQWNGVLYRRLSSKKALERPLLGGQPWRACTSVSCTLVQHVVSRLCTIPWIKSKESVLWSSRK